VNVFIPSKNRAKTIRTHKVFPDAIVVVHSKQEAAAYRAAQPGIRVEVSGVKADAYGLTRQREWICKNLAKPDEWFVFADDNVATIIATIDPYYQLDSLPITADPYKGQQVWHERMRGAGANCTAKRFLDVVVPDTITHCRKVGAHLAGFSLTDNTLFRRVKFTNCGYVIGKLMIWHNTGELPFDHTISMEDFYHTAINLVKYGACVVNRYVFPKARHYQPGGMGTYEERVPIRQHDVQELLRRFPGLFRVKNREGFTPNTDLQLCVTESTLPAWRAQFLRPRLI
jgi:hypothetical protein